MKQVTKDMNIREMVLMDEGIAEILITPACIAWAA